MISRKNFKEKEMMLTSHNLASLKLKKKIEAIPVENQTAQQKRFLANAAVEAKGMITLHDRQTEKQEQADADARAALEKLKAERDAADTAKKAPKVKADGKKKSK